MQVNQSDQTKQGMTELVLHVRNARKDVSYFCDVDGAATITRAVFFVGANGLDSLRCLIVGLPESHDSTLSSKRTSARLITNEGYQTYTTEVFSSPLPRTEAASSVKDVYAKLLSFSVDLGRVEPVSRESAAIVLFEAES